MPPSHNTLHTAGFHGDLRRLCGAKYSYLGRLIYDYPVVTCSPVKILGLVVKLIHEQKKTKKHSLEIKESGRNHEHRASGSNRLLASGQGFWFRQLMSALKGLWNRFLGLPGELNGLFILRTHYPSGRTWANLFGGSFGITRPSVVRRSGRNSSRRMHNASCARHITRRRFVQVRPDG